MFAKGIWSCAALLLVILSCVDVSTARKIREKRSTCVSDEHINGCSTPTGHEPYREEFTPACNEHDVCYFCVSNVQRLNWVVPEKIHTPHGGNWQ